MKKSIAKYLAWCLMKLGLEEEMRLVFNEIGNRGERTGFGMRENRLFSFDALSYRQSLDNQVNSELTYEEIKIREGNNLFTVTWPGFEPRLIWLQISCF